MDSDVRMDLRAKGFGDTVDLDVEVDDLRVIRGAAAGFAERHGVDTSRGDSLAVEGVLDTVDLLLERGFHRVDARGGNVLFGDGYRVVLSSDLEVVLAYQTVHRERTLAQVRSGVRSRLKSSPVGVSGLLARLDDETIDLMSVPDGLVFAFLGEDASYEVREDFRDRVRDVVSGVLDELEGLGATADLSNSKSYRLDSSGEHVLSGDGLVVVLRSDGLRVVRVLEGDGVDVYTPSERPARKAKRRPRSRSKSASVSEREL